MMKGFLNKFIPLKRSPQGARVDTSNQQGASMAFKQIASITVIGSFKDLPLSEKEQKTLLIENFSRGNLEQYITEEKNAKGTYSLSGEGLEGNCLKVHYRLKALPQSYRAVDLARKFILEDEVQDWSAFRFLNLAVKVEHPTTLLRICIVEEDGDWWNLINTKLLVANIWHWIRIPMDEMYALKDFDIHGDGKQDLSKVAELRIIFDSTNSGKDFIENTAYIDQVFLSN